jgi:hypothetical protein
MTSPHDITPLLRKQLILELIVWIQFSELVQILPRSFSSSTPSPLYQNLTHATAKARLEYFGWSWYYPAMLLAGAEPAGLLVVRHGIV